jgi:hypothetical protein
VNLRRVRNKTFFICGDDAASRIFFVALFDGGNRTIVPRVVASMGINGMMFGANRPGYENIQWMSIWS